MNPPTPHVTDTLSAQRRNPPLAAVALALGALVLTLPKPASAAASAAAVAPLAAVETIVQQRCAGCHAAHPTIMSSAPASVRFDTPDEISQDAQRIYQQTVQLKSMPPGNVTQMTDAERQQIAAWFLSRPSSAAAKSSR